MEPSFTLRALDAVAHDLRNDVNVVVGGVHLLLDPDEVPFAREVHGAIGGVAAMVDRLVLAAQIEAEGEPERVAYSVADLLGLASRRAVREGALVQMEATGAADLKARVVPMWAERLLTDVIHTASWLGVRALAAVVHSRDDADGISVVLRGTVAEAPRGSRERTMSFMEQLREQLAAGCHAAVRVDSAGKVFSSHMVLPRA